MNRISPRVKVFLLAAIALVCVAFFVVARTSRRDKGPYGIATDFPRGPLVYAQFHDLPAMIKQWDASRLKEQYLNSTNYSEFQHRHLALRMIGRLEEFSNTLGFKLDTAAISGGADSGAAVAVYDIGHLNVVFIAPISDEKAAASKFFQSKQQFDEVKLSDGTTYYRRDVEGKSGRNKQSLVFATVKGRFILASEEELLLRTISNINGRTAKDSLSDDPAFSTLSAVVTPHFATIWVDQAKLNTDRYFRRYWLMQNVNQLNGIRACIFDLEQQDTKWIERRDFLSARQTTTQGAGMPAADIQRLKTMIPGDVPFLKFESVGDDLPRVAELIGDTLEDRVPSAQKGRGGMWSWRSYDDSEFAAPARQEREETEEETDRYSSLDENYDSVIDDPHDAGISSKEEPGGNPLAKTTGLQFRTALQQAIGPAHPSTVVVAGNPRVLDGPLFAEFRMVAIFRVNSPDSLNRELLEEAIAKSLQSRVTAAGSTIQLKWIGRDQNGLQWRELVFPMLGWSVCYAVHEGELIFANNSEFLSSVLTASGSVSTSTAQASPALDDLTIIRLEQRKQGFDDVVGKLDAEAIRARTTSNKKDGNTSDSKEFFSGNLGSLLDVASGISQIEIRRSSPSNRLHEEIDYTLVSP